MSVWNRLRNFCIKGIFFLQFRNNVGWFYLVTLLRYDTPTGKRSVKAFGRGRSTIVRCVTPSSPYFISTIRKIPDSNVQFRNTRQDTKFLDNQFQSSWLSGGLTVPVFRIFRIYGWWQKHFFHNCFFLHYKYSCTNRLYQIYKVNFISFYRLKIAQITEEIQT